MTRFVDFGLNLNTCIHLEDYVHHLLLLLFEAKFTNREFNMLDYNLTREQPHVNVLCNQFAESFMEAKYLNVVFETQKEKFLNACDHLK